jgi:hypothetical protein
MEYYNNDEEKKVKPDDDSLENVDNKKEKKEENNYLKKAADRIQIKIGSAERTFQFPATANRFEIENEIINMAKERGIESISVRYVGSNVMLNDYSYHSLDDVDKYFDFLEFSKSDAKKR